MNKKLFAGIASFAIIMGLSVATITLPGSLGFSQNVANAEIAEDHSSDQGNSPTNTSIQNLEPDGTDELYSDVPEFVQESQNQDYQDKMAEMAAKAEADSQNAQNANPDTSQDSDNPQNVVKFNPLAGVNALAASGQTTYNVGSQNDFLQVMCNVRYYENSGNLDSVFNRDYNNQTKINHTGLNNQNPLILINITASFEISRKYAFCMPEIDVSAASTRSYDPQQLSANYKASIIEDISYYNNLNLEFQYAGVFCRYELLTCEINGNNNTITIAESARTDNAINYNAGLFGAIGPGTYIHDLTVNASNSVCQDYCGLIAGKAIGNDNQLRILPTFNSSGNQENYPVTSRGDCSAETGSSGCYLPRSPKLENVSVTGNMTCHDKCGGLIGSYVGFNTEHNDSIFKAVKSKVNIVGHDMVGGYVGEMQILGQLSNTVMSQFPDLDGDEPTIAGHERVGGIFGYAQIQGSLGANASLLKGDNTVTSDTIKAEVSGYNMVGGLIGFAQIECTVVSTNQLCGDSGSSLITDMQFKGTSVKALSTIKDEGRAGGLIGYFQNRKVDQIGNHPFSSPLIKDSYVVTTVNSDEVRSSSAGGFIGMFENENPVGTANQFSDKTSVTEASTDSSISGSTFVGDVYGGDKVGGFIGLQKTSNQGTNSSSISGSQSSASVYASGIGAGGFIGEQQTFGNYITGSIATTSFAEGSVTSTGTAVGGFVGNIDNWDSQTGVRINRSYSLASVHATSVAGGLIGSLTNRGTYATANNFLDVIDNSFAAGTIVATEPNNSGGLIGYTNHLNIDISKALYDGSKNPVAMAIGNASPISSEDNIAGLDPDNTSSRLATYQFFDEDNFPGYSGGAWGTDVNILTTDYPYVKNKTDTSNDLYPEDSEDCTAYTSYDAINAYGNERCYATPSSGFPVAFSEYRSSIAIAEIPEENLYTLVTNGISGEQTTTQTIIELEDPVDLTKDNIIITDLTNGANVDYALSGADDAYTLTLSGDWTQDDTFKVEIHKFGQNISPNDTLQILHKYTNDITDLTQKEGQTNVKTTKYLELKFDKPVNDLQIEQLSLQYNHATNNALLISKIEKPTTVTDGTVWNLYLEGKWENNLPVTVTINKPSNPIDTKSANTNIFWGQKDITLQTVISDGSSGSVKSTKFTLTFSEPVPGLSRSLITTSIDAFNGETIGGVELTDISSGGLGIYELTINGTWIDGAVVTLHVTDPTQQDGSPKYHILDSTKYPQVFSTTTGSAKFVAVTANGASSTVTSDKIVVRMETTEANLGGLKLDEFALRYTKGSNVVNITKLTNFAGADLSTTGVNGEKCNSSNELDADGAFFCFIAELDGNWVNGMFARLELDSSVHGNIAINKVPNSNQATLWTYSKPSRALNWQSNIPNAADITYDNPQTTAVKIRSGSDFYDPNLIITPTVLNNPGSYAVAITSFNNCGKEEADTPNSSDCEIFITGNWADGTEVDFVFTSTLYNFTGPETVTLNKFSPIDVNVTNVDVTNPDPLTLENPQSTAIVIEFDSEVQLSLDNFISTYDSADGSQITITNISGCSNSAALTCTLSILGNWPNNKSLSLVPLNPRYNFVDTSELDDIRLSKFIAPDRQMVSLTPDAGSDPAEGTPGYKTQWLDVEFNDDITLLTKNDFTLTTDRGNATEVTILTANHIPSEPTKMRFILTGNFLNNELATLHVQNPHYNFTVDNLSANLEVFTKETVQFEGLWNVEGEQIDYEETVGVENPDGSHDYTKVLIASFNKELNLDNVKPSAFGIYSDGGGVLISSIEESTCNEATWSDWCPSVGGTHYYYKFIIYNLAVDNSLVYVAPTRNGGTLSGSSESAWYDFTMNSSAENYVPDAPVVGSAYTALLRTYVAPTVHYAIEVDPAPINYNNQRSAWIKVHFSSTDIANFASVGLKNTDKIVSDIVLPVSPSATFNIDDLSWDSEATTLTSLISGSWDDNSVLRARFVYGRYNFVPEITIHPDDCALPQDEREPSHDCDDLEPGIALLNAYTGGIPVDPVYVADGVSRLVTTSLVDVDFGANFSNLEPEDIVFTYANSDVISSVRVISVTPLESDTSVDILAASLSTGQVAGQITGRATAEVTAPEPIAPRAIGKTNHWQLGVTGLWEDSTELTVAVMKDGYQEENVDIITLFRADNDCLPSGGDDAEGNGTDASGAGAFGENSLADAINALVSTGAVLPLWLILGLLLIVQLGFILRRVLTERKKINDFSS